MKRRVLLFLPISALVVGSCIYGILIHRNHFFPYSLLANDPKGAAKEVWSIGIYTGPSPFSLSNPEHVNNPVLTAKDITDRKAQSVADPFIVRTGALYYMFFEVFDDVNVNGDIGLAESKDGINWEYSRIVLDEPFHLSYPYIFKRQDDYYLIPESSEDFSVRLYKAVDFPVKWEYRGDLLRGYRFMDPSVVEYNGKWWMFVSAKQNDVLNLYYSDDVAGPWTQHPQSPIVKGDRNTARPAGRPLVIDGRLYRFAQDADPTYGNKVVAFEITEIDATSYRERKVQDASIVGPGDDGWNTEGMHHVDAQYTGENSWIAAVDGYRLVVE